MFEFCKHCGHTKAEHSGYSGPNSIGQWSHGECVNGCSSVGTYRFGGCQCSTYKRRRRIRIHPPTTRDVTQPKDAA